MGSRHGTSVENDERFGVLRRRAMNREEPVHSPREH
jgi:hypothetical protein